MRFRRKSRTQRQSCRAQEDFQTYSFLWNRPSHHTRHRTGRGHDSGRRSQDSFSSGPPLPTKGFGHLTTARLTVEAKMRLPPNLNQALRYAAAMIDNESPGIDRVAAEAFGVHRSGRKAALQRPLPCGYGRIINAVRVSVIPAICLPVAISLFCMSADPLKLWRTVYRIDRQAETVDLVVDRELHWSVDVSLFLVAADVEISVVSSPV